MAILITGGLGLIGSHLARAFRAKGSDVVVSDLKVAKSDGYRRGDVTQYVEMDRIFREFSVEHVFHFAGEVGRANGEEFPRRCIDINVSGTMNLIQLCLQHRAALYFASTSEVYGRLADSHKLTEDLVESHNPQPVNCYGISKLQAEQYLRHFVENYDLRALSFRFFMAYGPGEMPEPTRSAMATFVSDILHGRPVTVHRGAQRSWCLYDDIVEGCIRAMEAPKSRRYEAYNIGRAELRSIEDIVQLICDYCDKPRTLIKYGDVDKLQTKVKDASFEKAKRDLGFESRISVDEGIRRTIEWQRQLFGI